MKEHKARMKIARRRIEGPYLMSTAEWFDRPMEEQAKRLEVTKPDPEAPLFSFPEELGERNDTKGNVIGWVIFSLALGAAVAGTWFMMYG